MASLEQTLQVFRALLVSGPDIGVSEADTAIWAYLKPILGLRAQSAALHKLTVEVEAWHDASPFTAVLLDDLRRHRARLDEQPE